MCSGGGGSKAPAPPPPAPPPAETPRRVDAAVAGSRDREKNRLRALAGRSSTIATSGLGLTTEAVTAGKNLTGQ